MSRRPPVDLVLVTSDGVERYDPRALVDPRDVGRRFGVAPRHRLAAA